MGVLIWERLPASDLRDITVAQRAAMVAHAAGAVSYILMIDMHDSLAHTLLQLNSVEGRSWIQKRGVCRVWKKRTRMVAPAVRPICMLGVMHTTSMPKYTILRHERLRATQ
jgi:hypothetical protein